MKKITKNDSFEFGFICMYLKYRKPEMLSNTIHSVYQIDYQVQ